jgi:hypothetical protein
MSRFQFALVLCAGLLGTTSPMVAATYNVGTCKFPSFPDIQSAVNKVPAGSTVSVCPGSWAEQLTISTPLTLQGMNINNSEQTVITVPSGGLSTVSTSSSGTVAPQIIVNASPVNIANLTIDGTGYTCSGAREAGIYYSASSSGTTRGIEIRNEGCTGIGILAENSSGSITIANSNIHNVDSNGILVGGFSATVAANEVAGSVFGISSSAGSVTKNAVSGGNYGIVLGGSAVASNNTVRNTSNTGIFTSSSGATTGNTLVDTSTAISFFGSGAVQSNLIINANIGIEFNCTSGIMVTKNTINSAATGLDQVPAAFAGTNSIYNAATVRNNGPC